MSTCAICLKCGARPPLSHRESAIEKSCCERLHQVSVSDLPVQRGDQPGLMTCTAPRVAWRSSLPSSSMDCCTWAERLPCGIRHRLHCPPESKNEGPSGQPIFLTNCDLLCAPLCRTSSGTELSCGMAKAPN